MSDDRAAFARYIANGLFATAVHYAILTFLIQYAQLASAGAANLLAAVVGITTSFLGNRSFVFRGHAAGWSQQLWRFVALYGVFALIHATMLYVWTDRLGYDFRIGFLLATGLQTMVSFFANKLLVFSR
ncbi:MAG: GtrA family protein [Mesorhizobium sp.]|nr:GtrA family protein [Mesorhizobium sp.]